MRSKHTLGFPALLLILALPISCGDLVDANAAKALRESIGHETVTVFPAFVLNTEGHTYSVGSAPLLAELMTTEGLGIAQPSGKEVPVQTAWQMNDTSLLRECASDLVAYVRANPISTDYALFPQFLMGESRARAIQCVAVDSRGRIVFALLLNGRSPLFREAPTATTEECSRLLNLALRSAWREAQEAKGAGEGGGP
ncbi:MAG: hypothetical protein ACP5VF_10070 [Acidobacteriota bacterium]